jgi:N-acetylglucosaminyldiphosphoundecaprenol N-acetyl-beta-D-mannosaminyltransferase
MGSERTRGGTIGVCRVLGVPVHKVTTASIDDRLRAAVRSGVRVMVLHANAHGINLAQRHRWLLDGYRRADLVYCDGEGVRLAARLLGDSLPERITGADWLWHLNELAAMEDWRLFLLGDAPGVAERAAEALVRRSGRPTIIGTHHGFFDKTPGSADNEAVVAMINTLEPHVCCVGFGMPLQERWILENRPLLRTNVLISQGAAFAYVAGDLTRGPRWMTGHGLEWLARMAIEPRRLWRRYLLGNPLFLARVLRVRLLTRRGAGRANWDRPTAPTRLD